MNTSPDPREPEPGAPPASTQDNLGTAVNPGAEMDAQLGEDAARQVEDNPGEAPGGGLLGG